MNDQGPSFMARKWRTLTAVVAGMCVMLLDVTIVNVALPQKPVLTQPGIRRDAVRMLRAAADDTHLMVEAAGRLPGFNHPAHVIWAAADRVMPSGHGRHLAGLLPQGRPVEVADSFTLIPLDQPARLARVIRDFTRASAQPTGHAAGQAVRGPARPFTPAETKESL